MSCARDVATRGHKYAWYSHTRCLPRTMNVEQGWISLSFTGALRTLLHGFQFNTSPMTMLIAKFTITFVQSITVSLRIELFMTMTLYFIMTFSPQIPAQWVYEYITYTIGKNTSPQAIVYFIPTVTRTYVQ